MNTLAIILSVGAIAINIATLVLMRKNDSDLCAVATEVLSTQAQIDSANWAINDLYMDKATEMLSREKAAAKTAKKVAPKKAAVKTPAKKTAGRPRKTV